MAATSRARTVGRKATSAARKKTTKRQAPRTPRTRKPENMSLAEWQTALRREFGREQKFKLENLGDEPIFSRFRVTNPDTGGTYRVAVRGPHPGDNHCTCPDFAVNTLGTCKHVEFVLGRLERRRGGKKALAAGFSPDYSEVCLRYDTKREVVFRPGATCPTSVRRVAGKYFDSEGVLEPAAYGRFGTFLKKVNSDGHEVRCHDDALAFVAQVRDQQNMRQRLDRAFGEGDASPPFKRLLKTALYPFQRRGALFAAQTGRCLIADDMGLGKTIQAIAAVEILARHADVQRVLVVCPTSLKHQWQHEIGKFTDHHAEVVEGPLARRRALYHQDNGLYKITNYDVVHRDLEAIGDWSPDLVILDEAQRIKNWKTRTARSVKQLASPYAIVLTGTPLENRLEELHSIVEFVDRYRLGPTFRFLHKHQHLDETGRVVGYHNLSSIAETLEPILIRRTRDQVLKDLPERLDKKLFVPMTDQQRAYHEENEQIVARIVAKWKRYHFLSDVDQRRLMIAMQYMRMSCNSTYLIDQETDYGTKANEVVALLGDVFEDPTAKVVVFSQWVRTHEVLRRRFERQGWGHVLFHGGVPGTKRKELVKRFKQDSDCRLFLSTDAGGVGLNLQNASVVVIMDQPWNPAVLEQRIGRVHRLGQQRPVRVIHLIAQGAIEEGMLRLIDFKRSMFAGVLDGGADEVFLGGTRLKRFMESVEHATGAIPDPMPSPATAEAEADGATEQADDDAAATTHSRQPAKADEAWAEVAAAGLSLLEKIGRAIQAPRQADGQTPADTGESPLDNLITRDEKTGESYLKLPVPPQQTIQKIVDLLGAIAGGK